MFAEFFVGSDSFPMGGRNVQFSTLVYNPASARFENPRALTPAENPVCRGIKITQGIPASVIVNTCNNQMWYHHRCECRSGSLWLFEARIKKKGSMFGHDTSYLLLRLSAKAPALKAVYTLPEQDEANIHRLELTLNAKRILSHTDLLPDERNAFKRFVGETRDLVVDVTQDIGELPGWRFSQLEPAGKKDTVVLRGKSNAVAIQRIRRIRK